jgi:hypothetical protein
VTGRGGAELKMCSRLVERTPGETEVSVMSETNVTGILAQFGRGMIQDVSSQMFQRFTEAVRAELEQQAAPVATASATAPPIEMVSFGGQLLGRAVVRTLGRPGFWVVAAVVLFLILWSWLQ